MNPTAPNQPFAGKPELPAMPACLALILAILCGSLTTDPAGAAEAHPRGSRPNIIFIMLDDMGYGDLGVYGQELIRMPRVDRMAREGMRHTQAYSGSPVCAPARSVLMTGRHTGNTTVRGNGSSIQGPHGVRCSGGAGGWRIPLEEDDVTVAEVLRQAGYVTGLTGKWGLGESGTAGIPTRQGFDEWFGLLNQRLAHSYYPEYVWRNEERVDLEGNTGTREDFETEQHYVHDMCAGFALEFIREHGPGEQPFFLYLPYLIPHDRFQIPELEPYAAEAGWPRQARVYASMLTRVDRQIGEMLDLLEELGIDDNTIVFFCSDNGAANRYDGLFDSSGELRGRKRDLYEGGIRTVMIARWPGVIESGAVSHDPWYFADVLPTLAELAGADIPDSIDGVSVLPSLLSRAQPELHERPLYWEFHERGFGQAARLGDWKAVRPDFPRPIELYDLAADPGEQNDLAAQHPDKITWFGDFFREARTPSVNWPTPLDADAAGR